MAGGPHRGLIRLTRDSLCFLYLVQTLTSRKICSLNSVLTVLSFNAFEISKIKTSCFLTSFILSSLYCSDLLYYNFSSLKIFLWYFASELYITIKPLYLWIYFLNCSISVFCYIWIINLQRQYHSSLTLSYQLIFS